MTNRIIDERPALPSPEERLALPAPEGEPAEVTQEPERPFWRHKMVWLALGVLILLALMSAFCASGGGEEQGGGGPPIASVSATEAQALTWEDRLTAVGTVEAVQGVDVTSPIEGIVVSIDFANGGSTGSGRTLVRLDTTTERAQRAALAAQAEQARLAYERARRLIERGAVAQADVEQRRAEWQALVAQVREVDTIIEKKRVDAPFAGTLGIRQVSLGQYVSPGTPIVSLQQLSPIFVNFPLPERSFTRIREGLAVQLSSEAFADRTFAGRVTAIDPDLQADTRAVQVQATVRNADRALRPGMFADVTVNLPGSRQVVAVPTTAITRNSYGDLVYVVHRLTPQELQQQRAEAEKEAEEQEGGFLSGLFGGGEEKQGPGSAQAGGEGQDGQEGGQQPQLVARAVFVEVGQTRGLLTEITKGLKPGMQVVTAGQLKLENDAPIRVVPRDATQGAQAVPERP
ncbi:efflux RND transporter periplasmic adaptor subunit [Croceibacterium ferulae]|uniref:efflux RND transporter periplasmic adaptor subunit n=1 Tax=Croceibacterium ferulae TaxID=1854641 RepID=UPI000EB12B48|nr:efflux RND transporter periplasmic adaptor subunit [Croceibacterium ferulae]